MQGNRILLTIQVLILILTTVGAKAQTAHGQSRFVPADTVQSTSTAPKKENRQTSTRSVSVCGTVRLKDDSTSVRGALVALKGTDKKVSTDTCGRFNITLPDTEGAATLTITSFGTAAQEITTEGNKEVDIYLESLTFCEYIIKRPSLTKRLWWKIKNTF